MPFEIDKKTEEVFYASGKIVTVSQAELAFLTAKAAQNPRRIARLCTHRDLSDPLHEMVIVNRRETYIRPHKNTLKPKSFLVLEGKMDVVMFSDDGEVTGVFHLGAYGSGLAHYFRLHETRFHTLVTRTEQVVFQETTIGPFQPSDTVFAPWAPENSNPEACKAFTKAVENKLLGISP